MADHQECKHRPAFLCHVSQDFVLFTVCLCTLQPPRAVQAAAESAAAQQQQRLQQQPQQQVYLDCNAFLGTCSNQELQHMRKLAHLCAQTYYMGRLTVSSHLMATEQVPTSCLVILAGAVPQPQEVQGVCL